MGPFWSRHRMIFWDGISPSYKLTTRPKNIEGNLVLFGVKLCFLLYRLLRKGNFDFLVYGSIWWRALRCQLGWSFVRLGLPAKINWKGWSNFFDIRIFTPEMRKFGPSLVGSLLSSALEELAFWFRLVFGCFLGVKSTWNV